MKTPIRAIAAAALLTVLAGCASTKAASSPASPVGNGGSASASAPGDDGSSGGTSPSAGSPSSDGASPSAPAPASPPPTASNPAGAQVPLPPVSSTEANGDRIVYISPDGISVAGQTLSTDVQWGGCQEQPQLVVFTQDAQRVVVEVKTVTHFRMGVMCPNIERNGTASAQLAAPLAGRPVIDGVTGRTLTAAGR